MSRQNGTAPTTPDPPPSDTGANGRDHRGRFATGNTAGRGNPHARRMAQLRGAVHAAIGEEQVRQVFLSLFAMATRGHCVASAALLLAYAIGKPPGVVDPDSEGDDP